ncbi:MAG: aminotransferase class V-fold PLP-dependent enzyme, partial [Candidatus Diapherotrites archaeon]|nr:aminotransferase class V-fold PLP-dependent enzyme [Candidatus Diapherotrites archaeon]
AKAKKQGALVIIDGAQSVPHMPVNVKELGADFVAFSSHKMLGPTGIGVLYGRKELLQDFEPFLFGGDMITEVHWDSSSWNQLPYKFEAGTPNIADGIGFGAAIDYLQKIGMKNIREHEKKITKYALEKMSEIPGIKVFCPQNPEKQGGIVLFKHEKIEPHDLALALDEANNIAIRSGMHCAQPLVETLNAKGLARASFYLYTTEHEIDEFVKTLKELVKTLS